MFVVLVVLTTPLFNEKAKIYLTLLFRVMFYYFIMRKSSLRGLENIPYKIHEKSLRMVYFMDPIHWILRSCWPIHAVEFSRNAANQ